MDRNGHDPIERPGRTTLLALVAHDAKKHDLLSLLRPHRDLLDGVDLVATATTGTLLSTELDLRVQRVAGGAAGGDLQIGAMIADGRVDALIFLRDPLTAHAHEPDVHVLLRACDIRQVPVAINLASAEMLLHAVADAAVAPPAPCAPFAGARPVGEAGPPCRAGTPPAAAGSRRRRTRRGVTAVQPAWAASGLTCVVHLPFAGPTPWVQEQCLASVGVDPRTTRPARRRIGAEHPFQTHEEES